MVTDWIAEDRKSLPVLMERLGRTGCSVTTVRILYAMGEIRDPSVLPALKEISRSGKIPEVRTAALVASQRILLACQFGRETPCETTSDDPALHSFSGLVETLRTPPRLAHWQRAARIENVLMSASMPETLLPIDGHVLDWRAISILRDSWPVDSLKILQSFVHSSGRSGSRLSLATAMMLLPAERIRESDPLQSLIFSLAEGNRAERLVATYGLGRLGNDAAGEKLRYIASEDPDSLVAAAATRMLRDPNCIERERLDRDLAEMHGFRFPQTVGNTATPSELFDLLTGTSANEACSPAPAGGVVHAVSSENQPFSPPEIQESDLASAVTLPALGLPVNNDLDTLSSSIERCIGAALALLAVCALAFGRRRRHT
ncbi:MAG: hypothetical protein HYY93_05095 [Planctomycetes bacterium]|nr:hypothetical protein [Planctomycetota bacterium]